MKKSLVLSLLFVLCVYVVAQDSMLKSFVTIQFRPDRADWVYRIGEDVKLSVSVIRENVALKNQSLTYQWGIEQLTPMQNGEVNTGNGEVVLKFKGLNKPGFMTCQAKTVVDGVSYTNYINVAFEPDKIETTTKLPEDFRAFWNKNIDEARKLPLTPMMTLMPEACTADADVYHVRFQNDVAGSYIYGILSMPKKAGKYPALLKVPGAGVRPYAGDKYYTPKGIITLEIGIHGIPVNLAPEVYNSLAKAGLDSYHSTNMDNRDRYYYKRVYTGCVRAVDFLCSLQQVDSSRLGVFGGSQGGALAIVTASLDQRIRCLVSFFPALCELGGYYYGGVGGWPKLFYNSKEDNVAKKVQVSGYYDVVNFARFLIVPGLYIWGYNDQICPPTSIYAAYNQIKAPKQMLLTRESGHWVFPEQGNAERVFLLKQLGVE